MAAQLRDAGINVKRTILPGSTFWNDWTKYAVLLDQLEPPPAGAPRFWGLAYKSGEAWNEFGWANAEFDALLAEANAYRGCGQASRSGRPRCQAIIIEEGVTIQPYWRALYRHYNDNVKGCRYAYRLPSAALQMVGRLT